MSRHLERSRIFGSSSPTGVQSGNFVALAFVAGAVPIKNAQGIVIGAIGAGGGSPQQDHDVAAAAAAAL
jgi:uncharacterized protein GlcG (DUF336 family)